MAETQSRATYGAREITVAGVKVEVFPVRFSAARKFAAGLAGRGQQLLDDFGHRGGELAGVVLGQVKDAAALIKTLIVHYGHWRSPLKSYFWR